jgi:nucleotide-binding universal stress UspA family protein
VFVSYAGVTKIASVAEEIENPDRNIPIGMLGSLTFTTLLYVSLVAVMVGVAPAGDLSGSNIPMALAAEQTLAAGGVFVIVIAALIALVSTANAGILSSSRYPLAMSRDSLAPPSLSAVSDRFGTPLQAITLTGAVLLVMVAFVPIMEIAKLASAFKILVFVLINVALVAFREANPDGYDPSFEAPLYPFPQIFGIVGGVILIPLMGTIPLVGALLIIVGSLVWYYTYVRKRGDVDREGAATDAVRQRLGDQAVAQTAATVTGRESYDVLVAVTERTPVEREDALIGVATAIAQRRDGTVHVVRFDEVPDQTPLETATERQTPGDLSFETRMKERVAASDVPIEYEEIVSHETAHAVVNHADDLDVDAILLERRSEQLHTSVFGSEIGWIKRHTPCDVIEIEDRGMESVETIAIVSDQGLYDATKVVIADAIAVEFGASVDLLFSLDPSAPPQQRETVQNHLNELAAQFTAPVTTRIVEAEDQSAGLIDVTGGSDLLIISAGTDGLKGALFGRPADRIVEGVDCTAIMVRAGETEVGRIRRFLENRVF